MNIFKSFYPRTRKEHSVQAMNEKRPLQFFEIFAKQPSQSNANLNELDDMSNKDLPINDPLQLDQTNLDKGISKKNVTSTEFSLINANETTANIELKDVSRDEIILNNTNNNDDSSMKDLQHDDVVSSKEFEVIDIINNATCKDLKETTLEISTEAKNNDTMKCLKEFEDTLKEFDKTCTKVNCEHEIIDLDEFEDFLGQVDCNNTTNNVSKVEKMNVFDDLDDSKVSITTLENVDIISIISSTDDAKSQIISTQDLLHISSENETHLDGYNSSDFEFITEEEANMDGFIVNIKNSQDSENSSLSSSEPLSNYASNKQENIGERKDTEAFIDPGAGPSGVNKPKHEFEDRSYRNKHVLPEGDEYLGLFRGIYNPLMPVCEIIFLENKSVRASAMNAQYDGIGFDKQLMHKKYKPDSSEDEFEDEAKKCAQKILKMYPGENRKRRRRF